MPGSKTPVRQARATSKDKWWTDMDDGSVRIKRTKGFSMYLATPSRVALGLNEICCEEGLGKVYVLLSSTTNYVKRPVTDATLADIQLEALPELFYTYTPWSEAERDEWRKMEDADRYTNITARIGWVLDNTPVLPFTVEIQTEPLSPPRLDGLSGAAVTLLLSPYPYVGLTANIRAECNEEIFKMAQGFTVQRSFVAKQASWDAFQRWRVRNGSEVLSRMSAAFRDPGSEFHGALLMYGALRLRLIRAFHLAKEDEYLHSEGGGETVPVDT